MVRSYMVAAIAFAGALAVSTAARADQTMTLSVPIALSKVASSVQSFDVGCTISPAAGGKSLANGSTMLALNGSYNGAVAVKISPIADASLAGVPALAYVCRVAMFPQPPSAYPLGFDPSAELTDQQYAALLVQPATLFVKGTIPLTASPLNHMR